MAMVGRLHVYEYTDDKLIAVFRLFSGRMHPWLSIGPFQQLVSFGIPFDPVSGGVPNETSAQFH